MLTLAQLDPFPGIDTVEKYSHHFEEKQRVRVKADGRCGHIDGFNAQHHVNVRLDSGHFVECHPDEIEPGDWPSGEQEPAGKIFKVEGLVAAIKAGAVTVRDQVLIKTALANIEAHRGPHDPFGETESADWVTLRIMAERYETGSPSGGTLAKRAREWRVGQEVMEKRGGRRGRIIRVGQHSLELDYGDGSTGTVLEANVIAA